jgi:hypothetical protein
MATYSVQDKNLKVASTSQPMATATISKAAAMERGALAALSSTAANHKQAAQQQ